MKKATLEKKLKGLSRNDLNETAKNDFGIENSNEFQNAELLITEILSKEFPKPSEEQEHKKKVGENKKQKKVKPKKSPRKQIYPPSK